MNIPAASIKRFLDYTLKNIVTYNCGDGRLYDANGKPLRNWVGALVGFANSGYDREEWLKENGLK
ncbi:MAG: hypothetical protein K2M11_01340 [Paramuribaculum sp.]|nr:hypothetical protein [Paramuribaculum sp.]